MYEYAYMCCMCIFGIWFLVSLYRILIRALSCCCYCYCYCFYYVWVCECECFFFVELCVILGFVSTGFLPFIWYSCFICWGFLLLLFYYSYFILLSSIFTLFLMNLACFSFFVEHKCDLMNATLNCLRLRLCVADSLVSLFVCLFVTFSFLFISLFFVWANAYDIIEVEGIQYNCINIA